MFLESLDGRLLGNLLTGNGWKVKINESEAIILEKGAGVKKQQQWIRDKEQKEKVRIFNVTLSFN